ncbi:thiamine diphosphokinase [Candidatus Roizmanbacteria bacterium CG11_big_fil_rev_8_21_14_0_20_36_8]|uniref:Thiamine diphosphokinase n=2 Tax=Candidatus Roizmaniibacteriota TaxID=1752723 RepID=A0A2M6IT75_9BACT|nr:MAG: thiamine diphosphokinase [Candidatus Roizmanbacteria bacterium CG11_big_fil_rev_8_21_14_0_20_36_8]PIZ64561.1 MAG: thiamine diphosphokinase [Candidatus Roizmanbacteria bacterium CG_4_10_14_0_2_um_filter_36_9]
MKKIAIILNGDRIKSKSQLLVIKNSDLIIAADGGANNIVVNGIIPNIVVGDMDSIDPDVYSKINNGLTKLIKYKREKDKTDSELAVELAIENGAWQIDIFGMIGDRFDHLLSNVFLLSKFAKKAHIIIHQKNIRMYYLFDKIDLSGKKGDELSLIPLSSGVKGISTKGLQYELENETLSFGSTRGVSNVFTSDKASINVSSGKLIVIHRDLSKMV